MKVTTNRGAIEKLMRQAEPELRRRGEALRDACNAESSWGGYELDVDTDGDRTVARVYDIASRGADDPRGLRLLRKLDSAR